jgi:hypothetical protein
MQTLIVEFYDGHPDNDKTLQDIIRWWQKRDKVIPSCVSHSPALHSLTVDSNQPIRDDEKTHTNGRILPFSNVRIERDVVYWNQDNGKQEKKIRMIQLESTEYSTTITLYPISSNDRQLQLVYKHQVSPQKQQLQSQNSTKDHRENTTDSLSEDTIEPFEGKTGADVVTYWKKAGVIGSRPDIKDSQEYARKLRREAEKRN